MSLAVALACASLGACATHYRSACEELSQESKSQLRVMARTAEDARFERHVVLLETGRAMDSQCRSYFIDGDDYRAIPGSMTSRCLSQSPSRHPDYCVLFYLDGDVVNRPVF